MKAVCSSDLTMAGKRGKKGCRATRKIEAETVEEFAWCKSVSSFLVWYCIKKEARETHREGRQLTRRRKMATHK